MPPCYMVFPTDGARRGIAPYYVTDVHDPEQRWVACGSEQACFAAARLFGRHE